MVYVYWTYDGKRLLDQPEPVSVHFSYSPTVVNVVKTALAESKRRRRGVSGGWDGANKRWLVPLVCWPDVRAALIPYGLCREHDEETLGRIDYWIGDGLEALLEAPHIAGHPNLLARVQVLHEELEAVDVRKPLDRERFWSTLRAYIGVRDEVEALLRAGQEQKRMSEEEKLERERQEKVAKRLKERGQPEQERLPYERENGDTWNLGS